MFVEKEGQLARMLEDRGYMWFDDDEEPMARACGVAQWGCSGRSRPQITVREIVSPHTRVRYMQDGVHNGPRRKEA